MRCLLKMQIDTQAGNEAISAGTLPKLIGQLTETVKPEASYFLTEDGRRTAMFFFDLSDVSDIPLIAEPVFSALNATVTFTPVMQLEDLQKGLAKM